jgi:glutamate 5-kinase
MTSIDRTLLFGHVKRIVVKLGTRVIIGPDRRLDATVIERIAEEVTLLRERGIQTALVTSGAIGTGMGRLGLTTRPRTIPDLQAIAAVGQNLLMHHYEHAFGQRGVAIGQVLLTADDLRERGRYVNALNTLRTLFRYGVVPVINENDSVAVDEIKVGDNDTLAAYVTNLIEADLLIILSDIDGLYSPEGFGGTLDLRR